MAWSVRALCNPWKRTPPRTSRRRRRPAAAAARAARAACARGIRRRSRGRRRRCSRRANAANWPRPRSACTRAAQAGPARQGPGTRQGPELVSEEVRARGGEIGSSSATSGMSTRRSSSTMARWRRSGSRDSLKRESVIWMCWARNVVSTVTSPPRPPIGVPLTLLARDREAGVFAALGRVLTGVLGSASEGRLKGFLAGAIPKSASSDSRSTSKPAKEGSGTGDGERRGGGPGVVRFDHMVWDRRPGATSTLQTTRCLAAARRPPQAA
jgi:hypothetical protein